MPKKKSKRQITKAATDVKDDDFDKMVAEVTAADFEFSADICTQTTDIGTSSSTTSAEMQDVTVSDEAINDACDRENLAQLRQWGRQGVRLSSAMPLIEFTFSGMSLDMYRCLVKDLGADVNGAQQNDGGTPLFVAAQNGHLALVKCLVKELGADVNQARRDGSTPLCIAAQQGHLPVVQCLVKEFGANVSQTENEGATPLFMAAQQGHLAIARCLVKEAGADVNQARQDGATPLMIAALYKQEHVVAFLIKYGADVQFFSPRYGTATDVSKNSQAPAKQTEYLEARAHCTKPECTGAGVKKCAGCLKVFSFARECQIAHWSAHKAECRRSADKTTSIEK
jgi:hypothetical protein